jgi:hypothetical protein
MALVQGASSGGAGKGTTDWNYIYNQQAKRDIDALEESYNDQRKQKFLDDFSEGYDRAYDETKRNIVKGAVVRQGGLQ